MNNFNKTNLSLNMKRHDYIDQLKGVAMLLVVMGHILTFCGLGYENTLTDHIVMMNMPLFFFLNGLVIRDFAQIDKRGKYLAIKVRQLLLPFFAWGFLIVLFLNSTYIEFLCHYWKLGYWYLLVLFEFFVLHLLLHYINMLINRLGKWWADILIFLFMFAGLKFAVRFIPENVNSCVDYWQMLAYFPYFYLGGFIKRFNLTDIICRKGDSILTVLLITMLLCYMCWQKSMFLSVMDITLPLNIVLFLFVIFSLLEKTKSGYTGQKANPIASIKSILSVIGRHTLSIYMMQFFLFHYINFEDVFPLLYESRNYLAILLIAFLIAVPLCYICIIGEIIIGKSSLLSYILLGRKKN